MDGLAAVGRIGEPAGTKEMRGGDESVGVEVPVQDGGAAAWVIEEDGGIDGEADEGNR